MAFVGALIGAVGTVMQASAAAAQASYQAQVAENNKIIAGYNATYAIQAGAREESAYAAKAGAGIASAKAQMAASGIEVTSPSSVNVIAGAAGLKKLDELTIRNNALRNAYNFKIEGMNYEAQADLYEMQADSAMTGGILGALGQVVGAAGSLIGGASSVGSKWSGWQNPAPISAPLTYGGPSVTYTGGGPTSGPPLPDRTPWPGGSASGPSYFL